jgi:hypothetical protein
MKTNVPYAKLIDLLKFKILFLPANVFAILNMLIKILDYSIPFFVIIALFNFTQHN